MYNFLVFLYFRSRCRPLDPSSGLLVASWEPLEAFWWPLGGLLGASWGLLGASWGFLGPGGGSRGAPEAENTVKTTYFHVFCRVSGGPGDPPRNRSIRLREGNRDAVWAWGGRLQRGGNLEG